MGHLQAWTLQAASPRWWIVSWILRCVVPQRSPWRRPKLWPDNYDILWPIMPNLVHAEISNLRIHHWSFKGTEPLNMNMWVSFLLNVLENVGCKMCCYYHNWYQVAVSRCPWPWNCWRLRKQRPRCKSIIPWLLAGGFQQCWLSSYFQLSSNDGGYFFPWFSMWLCSIFWPIFVAKTTYLYSS